MEENAYESFVDAYQKANGDIDKIEMSTLPKEIQAIFSENDYNGQIELFRYCHSSDKLGKELRSRAFRYRNSLGDLQDVLVSDGNFEQNEDLSGIRDEYVNAPRERDDWLAEYKEFFKKQYAKATDKNTKEKIGNYLKFIKTFTAEAFVDAYKAAKGNIDKIEMSKMPSEIQAMFSENDYNGQIALFEYCSTSDKLKDDQTHNKLQKETKNHAKNLKTLQKVINSQKVLKTQVERDQAWFKEDPQSRENWRKGLETFFNERLEKENDPVCKKRIASYLNFLADPINFDINTIENDSQSENQDPILLSNPEDSDHRQDDDNQQQGEDYEENNDNLPEMVKKIKGAFGNCHIAIKAAKENQTDYPFEYNLYAPNLEPNSDVEPTGHIKIEAANKVVLASDDVMHFVATMKGIKENGSTKIELNLKGDNEDTKKKFAANAIVAGMLTGVEVTGSPYPLDDLKAINPMIDQVIKLKEKQKDVQQKIEKFESDTSTANEEALKGALNSSFDEYKKFSKDLIPEKEQLRIFKCGVDNIKNVKSRQTAQNVIANLNGGRGS